MSNYNSEGDVAAATLLSAERLADHVRLAGSLRGALAIHRQCLVVAGAMTPVLGLIEITLRNSVCEELGRAFERPDWLISPPAPFAWKGEEVQKIHLGSVHARRAIYAKMSSAQKRSLDLIAFPKGVPGGMSHEARAKNRQRAIDPPTGQLIAQLTLFFWKRLFSADYEDTLWKRRLRRLFPNKTVRRSMVASQLEVLYMARNRIAHHEPILGARLDAAVQSIDYILQEFGPRNTMGEPIVRQLISEHRHRLSIEVEEARRLLDHFAVQHAS